MLSFAKLTEKFNKVIQKPLVQFVLGLIVMVILGVGLIYYWRVVYSFAVFPPVTATIVAVIALVIMYKVFFFVTTFVKQNFALKSAILIFAAGVLIALVNPPMQAPDENMHFLRAYSMASGNFYYNQQEEYPNDVTILYNEFPSRYNFTYPAVDGNTIAQRFTAYRKSVNSGEEQVQTASSTIQLTHTHLPQAFGIFIGRLFGADALVCMYLARIANTLCYAALCYIALSIAQQYKKVFVTIMLCPIVVYMSASASYDAVLMGLMWVFMALCTTPKREGKTLIAIILTFGVISAVKMYFLMMLPLIFLFPIGGKKQNELLTDKKEKSKTVFNVLKISVISFFCFRFIMFLQDMQAKYFGNFLDVPYFHDAIKPAEQLMYIFKYPVRYILVFLGALYKNTFALFEGGIFGWLDAPVPLISYFTPIMFLLAAVLSAREGEKLKLKDGIIYALVAALTYGAVYTGMYLTSTGVLIPHINGVQMRYLLPAFFCLIILVSALLAKIQPPQKEQLTEKQLAMQNNIVLYGNYIFTILAAILLFQRYYLGV